MPDKNSNFPWVSLSILLSIGAVAALSVFSLLGHQGDLPFWGIVVAMLLGMFFICWTSALFVYLRWKGRTDREVLAGTVYGLVQGAEYQVMQTFTDYYKNEFQRGERLRFKERHFLPYHGGHTIIFEQRPLYLQEEDNAAILSNFSDYIARVDRDTL